MRIICVNSGDKFSKWYVDNLKYMIDTYSNLKYDEFEVITSTVYGGVYDKLQMFSKYKTGQNLYFDLDVVIRGECSQFVRKNFSVCHAYWRRNGQYYKINPINSSIISWYGDMSKVHDLFYSNLKQYKKVYYRGIDQYIHDNFKYDTFEKGFATYKYNNKEITNPEKYKIILFNQNYTVMRWKNWCQHYILNPQK